MGSIVKGKRMASSIKEVNLEVASKKVWLVKVRASDYQKLRYSMRSDL